MSNITKKSKNQLWVELFMAKIPSQVIHLRDTPTKPSDEVCVQRARLMLEECLETIENGLGVSITLTRQGVEEIQKRLTLSSDIMEYNLFGVSVIPTLGALLAKNELNFRKTRPVDLVEVADGLADQEYVNLGAAAVCGIAHQPMFEIVAANNMLKHAKGTIDEHGKLVKSQYHIDPKEDIIEEFIRQGCEEMIQEAF